MATAPRRPLGVTLLTVLASLAALAAFWHAVQMLHILPFTMGVHSFWGFDPIGALLWGFLGGVYVWLVRALWQVDPQAWFLLAVIAAFNLVVDAMSLMGGSTIRALWPSLLLNSIILVYVLLPATRKAFDIR